MKQRKLIYVASPLFSLSEKTFNETLVVCLEKWCDVFLPQRDGELIPHLVERGHLANEAYRIVFERDISALIRCDAVVINLDGRTIDEGAAFELGYAHALGKACIGYHTDPRVLLPWGLNPMIVAPLRQIFGRMDELEAWARSFAGISERSRLKVVASQ